MLDVKELIKVRDALNVLIAWRGEEAKEEDGIVYSRDNEFFRLERASRAKPKSPTIPESWKLRSPASNFPKATRIIKETIYAALCSGPKNRKQISELCRQALPASAENDVASGNGQARWRNALTNMLSNLKKTDRVIEHNGIIQLTKEKK